MVFKKIHSVIGDGDVVANKYQSDLTGMQTVIAQVEGPIVSGYMIFASEAHDDDGMPHTMNSYVSWEVKTIHSRESWIS